MYCVFDVRNSNVCFISKVAKFLFNIIMLNLYDKTIFSSYFVDKKIIKIQHELALFFV